MITQDNQYISRYFKSLTDSFFKILPLFEESSPTLPKYVRYMLDEINSGHDILGRIDFDPLYMNLILILNDLSNQLQEEVLTQEDCKYKVFTAIALCNRLSDRYAETEVGNE